MTSFNDDSKITTTTHEAFTFSSNSEATATVFLEVMKKYFLSSSNIQLLRIVLPVFIGLINCLHMDLFQL